MLIALIWNSYICRGVLWSHGCLLTEIYFKSSIVFSSFRDHYFSACQLNSLHPHQSFESSQLFLHVIQQDWILFGYGKLTCNTVCFSSRATAAWLVRKSSQERNKHLTVEEQGSEMAPFPPTIWSIYLRKSFFIVDMLVGVVSLSNVSMQITISICRIIFSRRLCSWRFGTLLYE